MNTKKITSEETSDRKGNLCMPENMGFLAPKKKLPPDLYRHLYQEDSHFTGLGKTFLSIK